jgi:hypothetical protein
MTANTAQAQSYFDKMNNNNFQKSYDKDNYNNNDYYYKSQKDISKCINTNININGVNSGNVNVGNKGQLVLEEDLSNNSFGERYYYDGYNKNNKGFDCVINNNNSNTNINFGVPGGNQTTPSNQTKSSEPNRFSGSGSS